MVFTTPMNGLGEERGWKEVFLNCKFAKSCRHLRRSAAAQGCAIYWHGSLTGAVALCHRCTDLRTLGPEIVRLTARPSSG